MRIGLLSVGPDSRRFRVKLTPRHPSGTNMSHYTKSSQNLLQHYRYALIAIVLWESISFIA